MTKEELLAPLLNKIFNEDCIEGMRRIPDCSIDAVITDPPYGISKKKPLTGTSHGKMETLSCSWDQFHTKTEFIEFTKKWLAECHRVLKPNGSIAVWGDRQNIFYVFPLLEQLFPKYLDTITWTKRDAPPNITQRGLAASTEFCLVFCKAEKNWVFNGHDLKKYNKGKQARNYLDIQRSMSASERAGHPTQKKIETQNFLIEMLSNIDNTVLDPFMGSGTTAVACKKLQRNFVGFEKDANYINIINKRVFGD